MQLSGSLSQSVLHRNLSHESQPIGGVKARPLFRDSTLWHSSKMDANPKAIFKYAIFFSFLYFQEDSAKR